MPGSNEHLNRKATDLKPEGVFKGSEDYNRIINRISDPIFIKDRDHRYLLVNDAMCAFLGKPRDALLGWSEIPDEVSARFWEQEEDVFRNGKEHVTEDTFPDREGISRTYMAKKSLLTDINGDKMVIGVLRDITEYKRLEAQFMQSQKMEAIGILAGGMAHDFNNLLNVINGHAELMLMDLTPDHPMSEGLTEIHEASQRAAALTSQLLAFGGKQVMKPEIFNMNQVIANLSPMFSRLIGEDIDMVSSVQPEPIMVNADIGKIQQVVMNLVVNARDAMPHGGKLTIETAGVDFDEDYIDKYPMAAAGPYAMLAISDNGVGMDEDTQSRVFEPFFTTKGKGKGSGLGMSTVYGIIKQSKGFIQVYSEPDKGTTVKVYFPRVTDTICESPAEGKKHALLNGFETVLIVEDEETMRSLVSRILDERGYDVLEAADGREALHVAREHDREIHLVITDVVMPGMSGKEVVEHLEEVRSGIKSLFISGYADNAIVRNGILDSGVPFLQKPFSVDSLVKKVRDVLDT